MKNNMKIVNGRFYNREVRSKFILSYFRQYLKISKSIIDVGCDENLLKKELGKKVTGVDIGGDPDYVINLEKEKLLRFKDSSFEMVVCTEVLEHLDNFYEMVDELARVSSKYMLISLPNCYDPYSLFNILFTRKSARFYGLPKNKPLDRHKWFFPWEDAKKFFDNYCKSKGYEVKDELLVSHFKPKWINFLIRLFRMRFMTHSYWVLIVKR